MQSRDLNLIRVEILYITLTLFSLAISGYQEGDYEGRLDMTTSTVAGIYQTTALHIPKERNLVCTENYIIIIKLYGHIQLSIY
jgi:hypothetical protein